MLPPFLLSSIKREGNGALSLDISDWIRVAHQTLEQEANAILMVKDRVDQELIGAVQAILNHAGKTIITGIGKSGHIGHKLAATFCSTGTPAVFLHAAEAVHGDLGIYSPGDPTILISKSGATEELVRLIPILKHFHSPMIALVGNPHSPLAREADHVLDISIPREADPLGITPTASTTVALAMGDALASMLMVARKFTQDDFARFHPGGQLGRGLQLKVSDSMHTEIAYVKPETNLKEVVLDMTDHPYGGACVIDEKGGLLGLITDGDIRRALSRVDDIRTVTARELMTVNPVHAFPNHTLQEAVKLMEERSSQISVLPVIDPKDKRCLGLIRLHDIYQPHLV